MTLEEEFQGMMKASYPDIYLILDKRQVDDMRKAFMGGALIALKYDKHIVMAELDAWMKSRRDAVKYHASK